MPISKRFILSLIVLFGMIWGSLDQYLGIVAQASNGHECILITYEKFPKYFLNAKTGEYWEFPDAEMPHFAPWISQVSPDQKFRAYLQPSSENPFGRDFDLLVEELETGERNRVEKHVAFSPPSDHHDRYEIIWSPDSKQVLFLRQGFLPWSGGLGIIFTLDGQVLQRWEGWLHNPQWLSDGESLFIVNYDSTSLQDTLYIWQRKTNYFNQYPLDSGRFLSETAWSPDMQAVAMVTRNTPQGFYAPPEHRLQLFRLNQNFGWEYALQVLLTHTMKFKLRPVPQWSVDGDRIILSYTPTESRRRVKIFASQTGVILEDHSEAISSPQITTTIPNNSTHPITQYGYRREQVFPNWRKEFTQSTTTIWAENQQIFTKLRDEITGEVFKYTFPYPYYENLTASGIPNSELFNFSFTDNGNIAHVGVFNPRTGQMVLEFTDAPVAIPTFISLPANRYAGVNDPPILIFSNQTRTDYYDDQGNLLLELPSHLGALIAPDHQTILGFETYAQEEGKQSYVWIQALANSRQYRYPVPYAGRGGYLAKWSPEGDFIMLNTEDYLGVYARTGQFLWQFPIIPLTNHYGNEIFNWARCDIFLRWGKIRVIENGYADKP